MISFDSRLQGETLSLRPSMIKFGGSDATDIEICGAAHRPLPFVLNRQLIKIMEDLGVKTKVFLDLQAEAIEQLRSTTLSPVNAASFLQRNLVGKTAQVSWLIRKLDGLGLSFEADAFLRDTVQMAVLVQLREIKHRSRIPVKLAVTLYGIMDETGYLNEGEIFCVLQTEEEGRSVIVGRNIIITRSPALHPGDIQLVTGVDVPDESPLNALHNCVVFSQKGQRDLPSQLSGGDLDGDIYNVIYDPAFLPISIQEPADYPRVVQPDVVDRVERHHMADFFIQFMENDRLGWIAILHQILADQKLQGTLDPQCILLAGKHSTAVDFSKTGVPV